MSRLERQLEEGNTRLHQYEKKKKKYKVSPQQHYHDGPVLSPTMESVPMRSPHHMPQGAVSRAAGVEVQYWDLLCVAIFVNFVLRLMLGGSSGEYGSSLKFNEVTVLYRADIDTYMSCEGGK